MTLFALHLICCGAAGAAVARFLYWAGYRMQQFRFWFFAVLLDLILTSLIGRVFR